MKGFENIVFEEESHTYTVRGVKYTPVSTVISKAKTPFDRETQLTKKAKELKVSEEELGKEWDAKKDYGCYRGKHFHAHTENHFTGKNLPVDHTVIGNQVRQFNRFLNQEGKSLTCVEIECMVYDVEHKVAGTFDGLFKDQKGNLFILDWKTNTSLKLANPYQHFKGELDHLDQSDFNAYSIQLSLYKYMIEKKTDLKIKGLKIVYFPPNMPTYFIYDVTYLQKEIEYLLKNFHTL